MKAGDQKTYINLFNTWLRANSSLTLSGKPIHNQMPHKKWTECMHGMQLLEDLLDTRDKHISVGDEQLQD